MKLFRVLSYSYNLVPNKPTRGKKERSAGGRGRGQKTDREIEREGERERERGAGGEGRAGAFYQIERLYGNMRTHAHRVYASDSPRGGQSPHARGLGRPSGFLNGGNVFKGG